MKKETFLSLNRNSWYVCDFETITINTEYYKKHKDTGVLLFYMLNFGEDKEYIGVSIEEWWNTVLSLNESSTIFFHNLSYDGDFIIKHLFNNTDWTYNNFGVKQNKTFRVFRQGGKIYYITLFFRKKVNGKVKDINIYIRCSYLLLSTSIEVLGKSVKIEKRTEEELGDLNFYDWEPQKSLSDWQNLKGGSRFIEYCKNDVKIAVKSLKNLEDTVLELPTIINYNNSLKNKGKSTYNVFSGKITAASLASDLLKKYVQKFIYENKIKDVHYSDYLKISKEDYEKISPWYYGGWSQINTDYVGGLKDIGMGCMIDVSSAYPYQMTKPLPYGEIYETEPNGENGVDYYTFGCYYVKSAKIKKEYKNVPILRNWLKITAGDFSNNERYPTELKNFYCYYLDFEFDRICKFYDVKVDYNKTFYYYMLATDYLKYFSYEVYNEKDKYSKQKNAGLKQATKIILNSAYGTLAKRTDFNSYLYIKNDVEIIDEKNIIELERLKKETKNDYIFYLTDDDGELKGFKFKYISESYGTIDGYSLVVCESTYKKEKVPNKASASVITALERCYLWDIIDKVGAKYFGLSDTDSVTFINLNNERFNYIKSLTDTGLGAWELEFNGNTFKYFATYGAKKYVLLDENKKQLKFKFAGLDQRQSKVKLKDYYCTRSEIIEEDNYIDFNKEENVIKNAVLDKINLKSGIILIPKEKIYKQTFN